MKLVVTDRALLSCAPIVWCIEAANTIMSSEDALREWLFPPVSSLAYHIGTGGPILSLTLMDMVKSIGEIPVVVYSEASCDTLSMVAVPVDDPSNTNPAFSSDQHWYINRIYCQT